MPKLKLLKKVDKMKKLICGYCHRLIKNNKHYKHIVTDNTLKIGTTYFIDITTKNYHYNCYRKMMKEKELR